MKEVKKVWGREVWIVNCKQYCSKILYLDKGAVSSMHLHPIKQETFYAMDGTATLTIEGKDYILNSLSRPKTIYPGQKHQFRGLTSATILETSTHHSDDDVIRFSESQKGEE